MCLKHRNAKRERNSMQNMQRDERAGVFPTALQVQRDASLLGFDWTDITGVLAKVEEEAAELRAAISEGDNIHAASELGDLLFAAVSMARFLSVDPAQCLQHATERFQVRLERVKQIAAEQGISLASCTPEALDDLWEQAKRLIRQQLEKDLDN
jgi:nucleoside triphosphate diphosphatase